MSGKKNTQIVVAQIRKYITENGLKAKVHTLWQEAPDRARGLEIGFNVFVEVRNVDSVALDELYKFAEQFNYKHLIEEEFLGAPALPPTVRKVWIRNV